MEDKDRSPTLYDLIGLVLKDTELGTEDKKSLIDELRKNNPGTADRWTYRWGIYILGFVSIFAVVGMVYLSAGGQAVPEGLIAIGSASMGGIAGILAPGRAADSR